MNRNRTIRLTACMLALSLMTAITGGAQEISAAEPPEPPRQESLYGIGSVSKVFTAAAVLRLAEQGKIDLDAPLIRYLPEFHMADGRYVQITPRMLLNHSSGLPGTSMRNSMLLGDNDTFVHDTLLTQLSDKRLKAAPGDFSVYCNDGYTLAELLVEQVSGMSFTDYLEKNFYEPMGINGIETPQSSFDRGALAPTYWNNGQELPPEACNTIGSGGIYASAESLCRFAKIFTRDYDGTLLSQESVKLAEQPAYVGGAWEPIPQEGSAMAYGLGWDSVNSYPFGAYGVKALSKGGDVNQYHASLTVLPEENITCAVLSSGGSSVFNSVAAREILLDYLRETGRLPKEWKPEEVKTAPVPVDGELRRMEGWYASATQFVQIVMEEDGLVLRSAGTSRDTEQRYQHIGNGVFQSQNSAYVELTGKLSESQNGIKGSTVLSFRTDGDRQYLLGDLTQSLPGLGEQRTSVPLAQRLEAPEPLSAEVAKAWQARNGKRYYLVNEKHTSSYLLANPSVRLSLTDGLPGYASLDDTSAVAMINQIQDEQHSRFFQTLPGQSGRDLFDLKFRTTGGTEYLEANGLLFCDSSGIKPLEGTESVVIGGDGNGQWFSVTGDGSWKLKLTAPENGDFFLYQENSEGLECTASSLTGGKAQAVYPPAKGRLFLAGDPGAAFQIELEK